MSGTRAVLAGDRELAQDLVQEALIRAHNRWSRIQVMDQPEAFVHRMIVSEYLSWRRRLTRRRTLTAGLRESGSDAVVDDHATASVERADLLGRLAALPRHQRAVLVLRYYEGLTTAEIAERLGCSDGAVRTYHSRAMATLRLSIDRHIQLEEVR